MKSFLENAFPQAVNDLLKTRRATRDFDTQKIPSEELLLEILETAHWAPSAFNLQPTHYILIENPGKDSLLHKICYNQRQILEAPWLVVFVGDADAWKEHLQKTIEMDLACKATTPQYAAILEKMVQDTLSSYSQQDMKVWLTKQAALTAMQFMVAAEVQGLCTSPMEGFDEESLKNHLNIPHKNTVPMVCCAGFGFPPQVKSRLPLDMLLHREKWS